jgi:hypothetical protein
MSDESKQLQAVPTELGQLLQAVMTSSRFLPGQWNENVLPAAIKLRKLAANVLRVFQVNGYLLPEQKIEEVVRCLHDNRGIFKNEAPVPDVVSGTFPEPKEQPLKLYQYECGCIGFGRDEDGNAWIIESCDNDEINGNPQLFKRNMKDKPVPTPLSRDKTNILLRDVGVLMADGHALVEIVSTMNRVTSRVKGAQ